jgi:nucleoside-diphosphate-sugar epimerase
MGISCHIYDELPAILSRGDNLVHCAGKVGNSGSWDEFASINIDWTALLFDQAAERGVSCFIYVSSVAALGYKNRPGKEVLDESSPPNLFEGELYGRSKLLAEQMLLNHSQDTSTRVVNLRPGLIYGRSPSTVSQTWLRRGIVVDPDQRVPLVHINSFVEAVTRVTENPEAEGVFLVVDQEQPTIQDLNTLKINLGILKYHPWRIGKVGYWLFCLGQTLARNMRGRSGSVQKGYALAHYYFQTRRLLYSTEKLRNLVGWAPAIPLYDGLKMSRMASPSAGKEV